MTGDVGLFVLVPCSVATGRLKPSALVEFGHGIFDSRAGAGYGFLREEANEKGWILWAMDWRGFSNVDTLVAARMLIYDSSNTIDGLTDAVVQVCPFY